MMLSSLLDLAVGKNAKAHSCSSKYSVRLHQPGPAAASPKHTMGPKMKLQVRLSWLLLMVYWLLLEATICVTPAGSQGSAAWHCMRMQAAHACEHEFETELEQICILLGFAERRSCLHHSPVPSTLMTISSCVS